MRRELFYVQLFVIGLGLFVFSCIQQRSGPGGSKSVPQIVREANVVYNLETFQTGHPFVPLLVSNGIVGGCFDHMGFQSTPNYDYPQGRTVFGYIRHYEENASSRQIQFPLAIIQAEFADGSTIDEMFGSRNYRQELDLYNGTLTTEYDLYGQTKITAFAHQTIPNLFVMQIDRESDSPEKELIVQINCETSKSQNNQFRWKVQPVQVSFVKRGTRADITSKTNLTQTNWSVDADKNNKISFKDKSVLIRVSNKKTTLKFFVHREDCPKQDVLLKSYKELYASHIKEWHTVWQKSWIDFPDAIAQKIWSRMNYYGVSHFPLIAEKGMIPTGLNSNIWGFTFPQDIYYVAENLPRTGHLERAENALKYWLDILPDVKKYTQRIMHVDGAFYPWTPPYEQWDRYERDGVVSADSYELHNPAYVLAMVWHYYQYSGDAEILEHYFPIIEEVWRFYANISELNEDGHYDVYHDNSRGQDEASTTDGKLRNLLCASFSAEYAARCYIAAAETMPNAEIDLYNKAKAILKAGYERDVLLTEDGYYKTYERDVRPPGRQKHPVQLNPIAFVPMPDLVTDGSPTEIAYQNRYELTLRAKKPITMGWTFGEFFLASVRMRKPEQAKKDLSTIQICRGADPRWIQFYESSFWPGWHMNKSYYFPMHGLFMQGYTDMMVQDWRGYVDLFACVFEDWKDKSFSFHGIRSLNGISVDGTWQNGKIKVVIYPNRARSVDLRLPPQFKNISVSGHQDGPSSLKGGQVVHFEFNRNHPIVINNESLFGGISP